MLIQLLQNKIVYFIQTVKPFDQLDKKVQTISSSLSHFFALVEIENCFVTKKNIIT